MSPRTGSRGLGCWCLHVCHWLSCLQFWLSLTRLQMNATRQRASLDHLLWVNDYAHANRKSVLEAFQKSGPASTRS
jgi:hypothetical protein